LKKEQADPPETLSDESKLLALQLENQELRARLERAEMIIDVQKKLSRLLGLKTETLPGETD
jgi:hypothetical protein